MNRIWNTVDRWGPGFVAIVTLIAVVALGWQYGERIARIDGRCEVLQDQVNRQALNQDTLILQAHVVKLQQLMIEQGIKAPDIPSLQRREE